MSPILKLALTLLVVAACGSSDSTNRESGLDAGSGSSGSDPACVPPSDSTAPTYSELYTKYFAAGDTPGHCANSNCHGAVGTQTWLCGPSKTTCYSGMVKQGLINPANPTASELGDASRSPLVWINTTSGFMPDDDRKQFPEGRDAIKAWIAACAQNN